jgi:hypothetical protein
METEHKDCGCNCEEGNDLSVEEMVDNNSFILDTLIGLLIEKKVITEEEFRKKLDANQEDQKSEESESKGSEEEKEE